MRTLVATTPRRASTEPNQSIGAAIAHSGRVALLGLVLLLGGVLPASAAKWAPITPADLAAKESADFPGADAEILLSTHVMEETAPPKLTGGMVAIEPELVTQNFVRAKVYTAKGVEDLGKFPIRFDSKRKVVGTEARVLKADGTITDLKKSDFFESVLAKAKGEGEWKQITFVFPNLEPGDVVEYRWTERIGTSLWLETFFCQETIPVREYRFKVGNMNARGSVGWMNCPKYETSDKDGFEVIVRNQPAFDEEENMPPELEFRGWIYVTKVFPMYPTDKDVWKELSLEWGDTFNMAVRPSTAIKRKAEALAAGATTDDEKLRRLYDFCQQEIFNTTFRTSAELQAGIDKHKYEDAQSPAKTLEKGRGRDDEVNMLFASLARGLGFEAKLARNASRSLILNVMISRGWSFLFSGTQSVAVKQGAQWRYLNPGCYIMPFGLMRAEDEGAMALLCDPKKVEYGTIGTSTAEQNQVQRKGRFTLDAEGTLEGEVEEVFVGHPGTIRKGTTRTQALDEVNKDFREEVTKRLPNAEVSDLAWSNLEGCAMPLSVKYRVRVPGYAEQAGKRLVFAPAFFASGKPVVFAAAERKFPIFFSYPWSEHDDIEVVLPEGYTLDKASAPAPVGELAGAFGVDYKLQYNGKTRTFGYRRDFSLGANGAFTFQLAAYPALKNLFELLHKSDTHSIMLKPKAAPVVPVAAPAGGPAPAEKQPEPAQP